MDVSERERVEHLFALYERVRALLAAGMKGKRKRRLGANLLRPYPDDGSFRVGNVNSITPDMSSWKKFIITLYPMIWQLYYRCMVYNEERNHNCDNRNCSRRNSFSYYHRYIRNYLAENSFIFWGICLGMDKIKFFLLDARLGIHNNWMFRNI